MNRMDFLPLGAGQQGNGKKRTKDDQDLELGCLGENALNAKVETRKYGTVVLEKTLESPLDCREIQPVHPKGDQS